MKKDNKPSPVQAVILAINLLPTDDSDTLDYTSKGRAIKNLCYNTTNDSRYLKSSHHQEKQKWALLKEDSTGSEKTKDNIENSERMLHFYELQYATVKETNVRALAAFNPIAKFSFPVVVAPPIAALPIPILLQPVVEAPSAFLPTATLSIPEVSASIV